MNWIVENWGMISAITTPILLLLIRLALGKVPTKYRKDMLELVQKVEDEMLKADFAGDENLIHNDDIKASMEKLKINLD